MQLNAQVLTAKQWSQQMQTP